jgi:hypothetical protein
MSSAETDVKRKKKESIDRVLQQIYNRWTSTGMLSPLVRAPTLTGPGQANDCYRFGLPNNKHGTLTLRWDDKVIIEARYYDLRFVPAPYDVRLVWDEATGEYVPIDKEVTALSVVDDMIKRLRHNPPDPMEPVSPRGSNKS